MGFDFFGVMLFLIGVWMVGIFIVFGVFWLCIVDMFGVWIWCVIDWVCNCFLV